MAEDKKPSKAEGRYGKTENRPMAKEPEHKPEGEGEEGGDGMSKHMEALAMMAKRHEKEHRDMHGNHRDAMRDMFARHQAEMKQMGGQMGDMDPSATAGAGAPQPADGQVEAGAQ